MELKTKIKGVLLEERKRKLEESFFILSEIRDKEYFAVKYISTMTKLVNEGYSPEEITKYLNEEFKMPTDFEGLKNLDWKGLMGDTLLSGAKEYIINFVLTEVFGVSRGIAATASQVFADYSPLDLLKPFKDATACTSHMPRLIDALLEALTRYVASDITGVDRTNYGLNVQGVATTSAGNLFGEVIRDSNISETISGKLCQIIH